MTALCTSIDRARRGARPRLAGILLAGGALAACAPASQVELGLDEGGAFRALADGDAVPIVRGRQGGVHLPLAARASLEAGEYVMRLRLSYPDGGRMFASSKFIVAFEGEPDADGYRSRLGLRAVLPSTDSAAHRDVLVSATLDDGAGEPFSTEVVVRCTPPADAD